MYTLNQIDNEATQKAVEEILRQYRTYMLTVPEERMPTLTTQYKLEMPNFSNIKQSAVENAAIENVDAEAERKRFFVRMSSAMRKLTYIERQLIAVKYLQMEALYNYRVYTELNISESTFYRMRNKALYKLALALGVEKYIDPEGGI